VNAIKEKIKQKNYPLEMLAYSASELDILGPEVQQHITPFMYACYRHKIECVNALIDSNRVDVDRLMLRSGCSALMLLLLNPPENKIEKKKIEDLAIKLFEKMEQPFALNAQGFNILHYAIQGNYNRLLKSILERADKSKIYMPYDITTPLVRNKKSIKNCDFDFCIRENRLDTLKILLACVFSDKTAQLENGNICSYIKEGTCFRPETLETLTNEQLQSLQDLLKPYQQKISKHTELLHYIDNKLKIQTTKNIF
jgi:ankyrin repeat protein